jgi:hypothetical protein
LLNPAGDSTIRLIALLLILFSAQYASAFTCTFFPDHTEVNITNMEDTNLTRPCPGLVGIHENNPVVILFSSPGGLIDHIGTIVDGIRENVIAARRVTGHVPTFVINAQCDSACIPILSGLNRMAGEGLIDLVIDPNTEIGFHGCSDQYAGDSHKFYSPEGTSRYLGYLVNQGGSRDWIQRHRYLFGSDTLTIYSPVDPDLRDSGILSNARIETVALYLATLKER